MANYTFEHEDILSYIKLIPYNEYVILDLCMGDEGDSCWMGEEEYPVDIFVFIRAEIMQGNYRSLYLLWMNFQEMAQRFEEDEEEEETSVQPLAAPAFPDKITPKIADLDDFAGFFDIPSDSLTELY